MHSDTRRPNWDRGQLSAWKPQWYNRAVTILGSATVVTGIAIVIHEVVKK